MTKEELAAVSEALSFLNAIEGAGYGGMARFEIAREGLSHIVYGTQRASCDCAIGEPLSEASTP